MTRAARRGAYRLAAAASAAAACLVLLASCASRASQPETPRATAAPQKAALPAGPSAGPAAAAAQPGLGAEGAPGREAGREAAARGRSSPSIERDEYLKAALADYRCEILKNGAALAVKRRPGQRNAAARILLARDGREESLQAGYDALALAAAARSVSGKGVSLALRLEDWDEIALAMSCPRERLADSLVLVAKALASPVSANGDFDASLREARVAERKDEGDPFVRAQAELLAARYRGAPRSLPPSGTAASLAAATRDKVMRYWSERFDASRLSIVVVGDFEPDALIGALEPEFDALPAGKSGRDPGNKGAAAAAPAGASSGAWFKALAFSGMPGQALIRGEFDAPESPSPDYPAMVVALAALDDLMLEALRAAGLPDRTALPQGAARGIPQGAGTKLSLAASPTASLVVYGAADPAAAKAAIDGAIAAIAGGRCLDPASSAGELASLGACLDAYKSRAIASTYSGSASSEGMAARIALDLSSGGDGTALFRLAARIREVKAEDVARVARQRLLEGKAAWVALGDSELVLGLSPAAFTSRGAAAPKP
jgi:predicted Zn-dependent peptidase